MGCLIDIHHHLIRAIDNDPADWGEVMRMLDAAALDGIQTIIATPHVMPGFVAFESEEFDQKLQEIKTYCERQSFPITVLSGSEIFFTDATIHFLLAQRIPTLNNSRFILVEWETKVRGSALLAAIRDLANEGYIPIIAHAERYDCLASDTRLIETLKSTFEVRLQVNCSSILVRPRHFGKNAVAQWLRYGLIDYIATDAHNTTTRRTNMTACYDFLQKTYGLAYANALTHDNQVEIVAYQSDQA